MTTIPPQTRKKSYINSSTLYDKQLAKLPTAHSQIKKKKGLIDTENKCRVLWGTGRSINSLTGMASTLVIGSILSALPTLTSGIHRAQHRCAQLELPGRTLFSAPPFTGQRMQLASMSPTEQARHSHSPNGIVGTP